MTQDTLPFQYQAEKSNSGLTGFAGLPLYIELSRQIGFVEYNRVLPKLYMNE